MSKRALRRHHRARVIARAVSVIRRWYGAYDPEYIWYRQISTNTFERRPPESPDVERYDDRASKFADHLKVCSGHWCGCGNPRRARGWMQPVLTLQERKHLLNFRESLEEGWGN